MPCLTVRVRHAPGLSVEWKFVGRERTPCAGETPSAACSSLLADKIAATSAPAGQDRTGGGVTRRLDALDASEGSAASGAWRPCRKPGSEELRELVKDARARAVYRVLYETRRHERAGIRQRLAGELGEQEQLDRRRDLHPFFVIERTGQQKTRHRLARRKPRLAGLDAAISEKDRAMVLRHGRCAMWRKPLALEDSVKLRWTIASRRRRRDQRSRQPAAALRSVQPWEEEPVRQPPTLRRRDPSAMLASTRCGLGSSQGR